MSDFTDKDRERLIETHTLVKNISRTVDDHEVRIRKNEGVIGKAVAYASLAGVIVTGAVQSLAQRWFGG